MLDKLDWADFVLLICTETYYRRFREHEQPDIGKGVDWEGQLITLEIYNAKSRAAKFVPVIFESGDKEFIPEPLSDQFYSLDSEDRYQELYSFLTGQAGVPLPELGPAIKMRKKNVKPLTFGKQSGKIRGAGKPDAGSSPSSAQPASMADSTQRERGGLPPSNEDTSNGERWKEIVLYALISLISFLCGAGPEGSAVDL
jgi:hypothetical protein